MSRSVRRVLLLGLAAVGVWAARRTLNERAQRAARRQAWMQAESPASLPAAPEVSDGDLLRSASTVSERASVARTLTDQAPLGEPAPVADDAPAALVDEAAAGTLGHLAPTGGAPTDDAAGPELELVEEIEIVDIVDDLDEVVAELVVVEEHLEVVDDGPEVSETVVVGEPEVAAAPVPVQPAPTGGAPTDEVAAPAEPARPPASRSRTARASRTSTSAPLDEVRERLAAMNVDSGAAPRTERPARERPIRARKAASNRSRVPDWTEPQEDGGCTEVHPVKVKLRSRLFHLPGMLAYDRTHADRCYRSAEDARADGFEQAKR